MRDVSRPLSLRAGTRAVFDLALQSMAGSSRSLAIAVVMGLPVLFGVLFRAVSARITPATFFADIVAFYYVANVLPLAALFYAASLVSEEVEGKTLQYLLTRPLPRIAVVAGKFSSYLATGLALCLPPLVVTFLVVESGGGFDLLRAGAQDLLRDVLVFALAILAYGAFFLLLGVVLRRPLVPGLLFLYGWELLASRLPGYLPRFTIAAYLKSLLGQQPTGGEELQLFFKVIPGWESVLCLLAIAATSLALAFWIFSNREYVVSQ